MTEKSKTCAVNGLLFGGQAACGHHISGGNKCGVPESQCEHKVETEQELPADES